MEEQNKRQDQTQRTPRFSRRSAVKVLAGLFAFIPAAKNLLSEEKAYARIPCADCNIVSCSWQDPVCSDPYCTGKKRWWYFEICYDGSDVCTNCAATPVANGYC